MRVTAASVRPSSAALLLNLATQRMVLADERSHLKGDGSRARLVVLIGQDNRHRATTTGDGNGLTLGGINEKPKLVLGGKRGHGEHVHGSIDKVLQPF
jgi:hypothetical protein